MEPPFPVPHQKVVAVIGPTASGKSSVAMSLAQAYDGELVCADSRTVYKDLQLGAATPPVADQKLVPHHLVGILSPGELLTVPEFGALADAAISQITSHNRLPIVVGGTRLFVGASLYELRYQPTPAFDELATLSLEDAHSLMTSAGLGLPLDWEDRAILRRMWRSNRVESLGPLRRPTLILALRVDAILLEQRIRERMQLMLNQGLEEEVRELCIRFGRRARSFFSIGYDEWDRYFTGIASYDEVVETTIQNCIRYANGQTRWLERAPDLTWVSSLDEAHHHTKEFLS